MKNHNSKFKIKYLFAAIAIAGLLLASPGTGLAANLSIQLTKVNFSYSIASYTKQLDWMLYDKAMVKEEFTVGSAWAVLDANTPPRNVITKIPLIGEGVDSFLGAVFGFVTVDIDPTRTDKEVIFKGPGFTKEYKAESQTKDFEYRGVKFTVEIKAGAGAGGFSLPNPLGADTFEELVERLINFAFVVSLAVAPLMVLVAGIMFLFAGGKPDLVTRARKVLFWTILGFAIVLLAKGLIAVLKSILGAS